MNEIIVSIIGYLASALLALSLLVNNDLKFRWLNTFGCFAFIVYGMLIGAFPIIITNTILLIINTVYLVKIYNTKEDFDLLEFDADNEIIKKFLAYYSNDIQSYFPGFHLNKSDIRFVVLRDMVIANIFAALVTEDGKGIVQINYTVPNYRDYKVGRFIFEREKKYLISKGINMLVYNLVHNKNHEEFLKVMGFKKMESGYIKTLLPL